MVRKHQSMAAWLWQTYKKCLNSDDDLIQTGVVVLNFIVLVLLLSVLAVLAILVGVIQ